MEVFLSWSGRRSEAIARALYDWIPLVLQQIKPFISRDIEKGSRWDDVVSEKLESASFGIICLTAESLSSDWLLFEAGALSKKVRESRVCTYLYQLNEGDVGGPLAKFQHTRAEHDDTKLLIETLNRQLGANSLDAPRLDQTFKHWWPNLQQRLANVGDINPVERVSKRDPEEKLEEILVEVRGLRRVSEGSAPSFRPSDVAADFLNDQRARTSSKWRRFRAAVLREIAILPGVEIVYDAHEDVPAQSVANVFDVIAVVNGRRVGIDFHIGAQFAAPHLFPEFASTHALHFIEALRQSVCDLIFIGTDRDLSSVEPFRKFVALAQAANISGKLTISFGTPQEIAVSFQAAAETMT